MRKLTKELVALIKTASQIGDRFEENGGDTELTIRSMLVDFQDELSHSWDPDECYAKKILFSIQDALRKASKLPGYHHCLKLADKFVACEPFEEAGEVASDDFWWTKRTWQTVSADKIAERVQS